MREDGNLHELNREELKRLNQLCLSLKCREKLEEYRLKKVEELRLRQEKVCLNKEQALEEIKKIQENLNDSENIIYFFTNDKRIGPGHFECLYIRKTEIIKPVHWYLDDSNIIDSKDLNNLFITDLSNYVSPVLNFKLLQPQVDLVSCGTLGLMYLKELLKNDAHQLNMHTLKLTLIQEENELVKLFIPSPHVLRYSQSSFYNSLLLAMIKNDKESTIKYKNIKYRVKPLKQVLEDSLQLARKNGNNGIIEENTQILKYSPPLMPFVKTG